MTRSELDRALLDLRFEILGNRHSQTDPLQLYTRFWKRTDWLIAESVGADRIHAREALNDLLSVALVRGLFDLSCMDTQASQPVQRARQH
jgi:hypothetical protein